MISYFVYRISLSILNLFPVASTRSKQITTVRLNHANGNYEAIH